MKKPVLVCVTGPDGSGKSTLVQALSTKLPGSVVMTIWDVFNSAARSLTMFNDVEQVDRYLGQLHPASRSLFLMHAINEAFERSQRRLADYVITDGYWYKYYATEVAAGAQPAYLDMIVSHFREPEYLFSLVAAEHLTAQRKGIFSRYECGFAEKTSEKTFTAFQQRTNEVLDGLMTSRRAVTLDAKQRVEQNVDLILRHIQTPPYDKSHAPPDTSSGRS